MNNCDFCTENLPVSFGDRIHAIINDFAVAQTRHPLHEFHLLIFDTVNHTKRLHDYSDNRIVDLKNLISTLDKGFRQELSNYLGYNLTSNNGESEIGQHIEHSHVHMFMRFKGEKKSPFDEYSPDEISEYLNTDGSVLVTKRVLKNIQGTQLRII